MNKKAATLIGIIVVILLVAGVKHWKADKTSPCSSTFCSIQPAIANSLENPKAQNRTENPQATFIELGSVRCIPCKMMQPVMEAIEKEYAGKVKIVFHDVWTPQGEPYAKKYGIAGIPTQIFFDKDGKEFFRHTGFFPKEEIVKILEKEGITK